jgi:hypothetical protein
MGNSQSTAVNFAKAGEGIRIQVFKQVWVTN